MAHEYTPSRLAEPYSIDPTDQHARGQLMFAARHGDARAKATLKAMDAEHPRERPEQNTGAVERGRALFRASNPRDDFA